MLKKNLEDPRYVKHVVGRLLDLDILDIKTEKISTLLLSNDDIFTATFHRLLDAAEEEEAAPWVESKLGDLLAVCARSDSLKRFETAAAAAGVTFNPEGDYEVYYPTLTLSSGAVLNIYLDMDEVRDTALAYYIGYNKKRLGELLGSGLTDPEKIGKYVSGYLTQIVSDAVAVEALSEELTSHKVFIVPQKNKFVLKSREKADMNDVPLDLDDEVLTKYLMRRMKRQSPTPSATLW